jgi:hypothetical protein
VTASIGSLISMLRWMRSTSEKCTHINIVENMPADRKASNRRVLFLLKKSLINIKAKKQFRPLHSALMLLNSKIKIGWPHYLTNLRIHRCGSI